MEKKSLEYNKKYSITIKGMEFGFSNGEKTKEYEQNREKIEKLKDSLEYWQRASFILSGTAILLSLYFLLKKKEKKINIGCLAAAVAALLWHYIAVGITVGVSLFVLLILISTLGC